MLHRQRADVRKRSGLQRLLCRLGVVQQRASRLHRERRVGHAERGKVVRAQLRGQPPDRGVGVELPRRQRPRRHAVAPGALRALGIEKLAWREPFELGGELCGRQIAQWVRGFLH